MLVLHANWINGGLHLWGESLPTYAARLQLAAGAADRDRTAVGCQEHPFACSADELQALLNAVEVLPKPRESLAPLAETASATPCSSDAPNLPVHRDQSDAAASFTPSSVCLRLPCDAHGPWPSDRLARRAGAIEMPVDPWLGEFQIPSLTIAPVHTLAVLLALEDRRPDLGLDGGHALRYWIAVAHCVVDLLVDQRFIPTLMQGRGNGLTAAWRPWMQDDDVRRRVGALLLSMPPIVRAAINGHRGQPWPILSDALNTLTDVAVRQALAADHFIDAITDRDPATDPHVAWLTGLLDHGDRVTPPADGGLSLLRDVARWVGELDDTGQDRPLHLCLRLNEPYPGRAGPLQDDAGGSTLPEGPQAPDQSRWMLSLHLQSPDHPSVLIDAAAIWSQPSSGNLLAGQGIDHPAELLLAELGRASHVYPKIETALSEKQPAAIELNTHEAYEFLREIRPLLEESGFGVIVPEWWDQPLGRLAARLHVEAPSAEAVAATAPGISPSASMLGLNSIVKFRWQIAIGDQPLTMEEFQALSRQTAPLVQVRGRWIEISPDQLAHAREVLQRIPSGETTLLEAIRIAHGGALDQPMGLPVHGMDATGWVADVLGASSENHRMPRLDQPGSFVGELRPYQKTGLSWLAFLDRFGLGACLADDMGLGKTIQLIALLLHERGQPLAPGSAAGSVERAAVGPTLLIVPTSLISNWERELHRFAPSLTIHVQHGPDRPLGDPFVQIAAGRDIVITTYPLISRDQETLQRMQWHRVALDEAQYIKNPPTKQTTAIRSLRAARRLALTGTPVENRLSELWSIMEFCNPGYLGSAGEFRRKFAVPIERRHDRRQAERLRLMVRPFVLRRVKTDPKVIDDLPPCVETKEYATLTLEQAARYQQVVNAMLGEVDRAADMQRRGLVLATLVKLKQICNHPEQGAARDFHYRSAEDAEEGAISTSTLGVLRTSVVNPVESPDIRSLSARSGKARRLITMLEEVIASGEKALIFTQFRQMGHLLTAMIQSDLDCETLFLHGGTPAAKRQHLIDRFQSDYGGVPIFVLSLKAGGLGLNLTAANHVFHYDRWWNPAVENQATDRAFRIGQVRTVHVHKFVCLGTLEERIDQMIEQKTELAQNIIGAGEQWLTELSTSQLHDLLVLRPSAIEGEAAGEDES